MIFMIQFLPAIEETLDLREFSSCTRLELKEKCKMRKQRIEKLFFITRARLPISYTCLHILMI